MGRIFNFFKVQALINLPILPAGSLERRGIALQRSDSNTSFLNLGSGSMRGYNPPPEVSGCFLNIICKTTDGGEVLNYANYAIPSSTCKWKISLCRRCTWALRNWFLRWFFDSRRGRLRRELVSFRVKVRAGKTLTMKVTTKCCSSSRLLFGTRMTN